MHYVLAAGSRFLSSDFTDSELTNVNFMGIEAQESIFDNCDLAFSRFVSAKLKHCRFTNCNLKMVDFTNAETESLNFHNSNYEHRYVSTDKKNRKVVLF